MAGDGGDRLALEDFRPRQELRVPETHVPRPRFPAIDAHNHLGSAFGGDWATRPASDLAAVMDAAGVEAIVDLDGGWGEGLRAEIERWQAALPGRVAVFAGLDYARWADDAAFGETEAARLARRRGGRRPRAQGVEAAGPPRPGPGRAR